MNIIKTKFPGLLLLEPRVFADSRGYFFETHSNAKYKNAGIAQDFVQDNVSHSKKNVLRGLHYQLAHPQAKLVSVLRGAALDVVVDIRRGSPTFGQWQSFELNDVNHRQLLVPVGFAHGFVALSEDVDFLYKCSDYYDPQSEFGIYWNDPALNIPWPVADPILSEKDRLYPTLKKQALENLPIYEEEVRV